MGPFYLPCKLPETKGFCRNQAVLIPRGLGERRAAIMKLAAFVEAKPRTRYYSRKVLTVPPATVAVREYSMHQCLGSRRIDTDTSHRTHRSCSPREDPEPWESETWTWSAER